MIIADKKDSETTKDRQVNEDDNEVIEAVSEEIKEYGELNKEDHKDYQGGGVIEEKDVETNKDGEVDEKDGEVIKNEGEVIKEDGDIKHMDSEVIEDGVEVMDEDSEVMEVTNVKKEKSRYKGILYSTMCS